MSRSRSPALAQQSVRWSAHRTAARLHKKGDVSRCIGRPKGGLNSKLHAVCEGAGKPVALLLSEGQRSDDKGAALFLDSLRPGPRNCWQTEVAMPTGSGRHGKKRASLLVSRPRRIESSPLKMTRRSINSATRSKIGSPNSRTGGALPCATTAAPTLSSPPFASPLHASSISINES